MNTEDSKTSTPAHPRTTLGSPRPRVGVILAAGRSERLGKVTRGHSKLTIRLGGESLVERAVRMLLANGLDRVVVVVGHRGGAVTEAVSDIAPGRVEVVRAADWQRGNGASLAAAEEALAGEDLFMLLCADHVFSDGALRDLISNGRPAVLVDESPSPDAWAEGTRVRVRDGRVLAFGKHLDQPAIDCGVFVVGPEVFEHQRRAAEGGDFSLAGAVTSMSEAVVVRAEPIPASAWWQDVDTPHDLRTARTLVRRSLIKETDGPVSRFLNRPISTRLSMALARFRPPPHLLSLLAFVTGLTSAWLLAWEHGIVGGMLIQASSVLDGVDGETARLQRRGSRWGARLDGILDRMVDAAIVAGLILWAMEGPFRPRTFLVLGLAASIWCVVALAGEQLFRWLEIAGGRRRPLGVSLGGRDVRLLLLAVGAVAGRPLLVLIVGTVIYLCSVTLRVILARRPDFESATLG